MSKLPFFTWHNILCAAVIGRVGAVGAAFRRAAYFYACRFSLALARRCRTQQYSLRTATRCRVSVKCFSGEKVRCAVLVRAEPSNVRAARQFHSRRRQRRLLRSRRQQMAALNFVHFFL